MSPYLFISNFKEVSKITLYDESTCHDLVLGSVGDPFSTLQLDKTDAAKVRVKSGPFTGAHCTLSEPTECEVVKEPTECEVVKDGGGKKPKRKRDDNDYDEVEIDQTHKSNE